VRAPVLPIQAFPVLQTAFPAQVSQRNQYHEICQGYYDFASCPKPRAQAVFQRRRRLHGTTRDDLSGCVA